MWRYEEVMPRRATPVTLGEGMTPLLHAPRLGERLGLDRLYIKDEGQNPTNSFKARGLSAAVSMAKALGIDDHRASHGGQRRRRRRRLCRAGRARCVIAMPADTPARSSSNAARSAPTSI